METKTNEQNQEQLTLEISEQKRKYEEKLAKYSGRYVNYLRFAHDLKNKMASIGCSLEYLLKNKEIKEDHVLTAGETISYIHDIVNTFSEFSKTKNLKLYDEIKQLFGFTEENIDSILKTVPENHTLYNLIQRGRQKARQCFDEAETFGTSPYNFREIVQNIHAELPENINFKKEISTEKDIASDIPEIEELLSNLVNNSAEAMNGEGEIKLFAKTENGYMGIILEDDGKGIPEEHLPKIFDNGFTHGKVHGTGYGLSRVKEIVDKYNGKISVESREGKGTKFMLEFPESYNN